eukprot:3941680-Rhodomonas_salina.4
MVCASGHAHSSPPRPKVHSRQSVPHLPSAVASVVPVTKPKLTIIVIPPALDTPVVQKSTCVVSATRNARRSPPPRPKVHRRQSIPHMHSIRPTAIRVAKTQLANSIDTPALDAPVVQNSAYVKVDSGNARRCAPCSK